MTQATLRTVLRLDTRVAHEAVERAFAVFDLATPDGYRNFLLAQAHAVLPLEAALSISFAPVWLHDWNARRRASALTDDLREMGVGTLFPTALPSFASSDAAVGALYVLEGSRLGGKVLLQRVLAARPTLDFHAVRFLRHAPSESGWPDFVERLDAYGLQCDHARVIEGALQTFEIFRCAAKRVHERVVGSPALTPSQPEVLISA